MKKKFEWYKLLTSFKKKFEWSKLWMALIVLYGIGCGVAHYAAVFMDKMSDPALAVQAVITILGGYMSYLMYQFGLKNSRNKYGIDSDGVPYSQRVDSTYGEDESNEEVYG